MTGTLVEGQAAPIGRPRPSARRWLAAYRYPLTILVTSRVAVYLLIAAAGWTTRVPRESALSWHALYDPLGQWDAVVYFDVPDLNTALKASSRIGRLTGSRTETMGAIPLAEFDRLF